MLLLVVSDVAREVVVRVRSARDVDAEGDVEPCAVAGQAHQQQARSLPPVRHRPVSGVQRAQPEALDERRHARLGVRVVAGDEHVQRAALGQDVAEDGVERLHDVRARRGGPGDLLRAGGSVRRTIWSSLYYASPTALPAWTEPAGLGRAMPPRPMKLMLLMDGYSLSV